MFIVGLTGGIAGGKSTVADLFTKLDIPIIDADLVAREVVEKGSKGLQQISNTFGTEILTTSGELDRKKMRAIIFSNESQRRQLESILHPLIRRAMQEQANRYKTHPYIIFVIPLLFETGRREMVNRVLVVDCDENDQIARVIARDGVSPAEARNIIAAQVSREERLAQADDIVVNDGDPQQLVDLVQQLHEDYLELAKNGAVK